MSNCKWFQSTNSTRKGVKGQSVQGRGGGGEGKSGVLWVLKVSISSEGGAPASNKMWNRSRRRKAKEGELQLVSYFWQIFQRLGLRVDFGFLTLTSIPIAILSPSSLLSSPAIRLAVCACDRMAKSHRLWVLHYVLALQRGRRAWNGKRKTRRNRNRTRQKALRLCEFCRVILDWQGTKSQLY